MIIPIIEGQTHTKIVNFSIFFFIAGYFLHKQQKQKISPHGKNISRSQNKNILQKNSREEEFSLLRFNRWRNFLSLVEKNFRHAKFFFFFPSLISEFYFDIFCASLLVILDKSRNLKARKKVTMKFLVLFVLILVSAETRKWIIVVCDIENYFNEWIYL